MPRKRRPSELLEPGAYEQMLAAQGGGCAICGTPPRNRRLDVDHDHRTGRVRGLLCWTCNHHILGKYATPAKLRAAADYLDSGGADGPGVVLT